MLFELLLASHITGACVTGVAASYAGIAMWRVQKTSYRPLALALGFLAGFEILTGTALSVISSQITALSLCANIVVYLSVVFAIEFLLFFRMRKVSLIFPALKISAPIISALSLFAGAMILGF